MTRVEFLNKVIAMTDDVEMVEYAKARIESINSANEKKKSKTSETRAKENEPIKAKIVEFLSGKDFTLASEIAKGCEISTSKASALLKQIDNIVVTDVKVPKVGNRKAYKLA